MDQILSKHSKKLNIPKSDLRAIIQDILSKHGHEEKLLDLLGPESMEDIQVLCTAQTIKTNTESRNFEAIEAFKYTEHKFDQIESAEIKVPLVSVNAILGGERIFSFSHFNYVQSCVFEAVYLKDENVLVSAPTGCGKTEIAVLAILRNFEHRRGTLNANRKVVYIAPMKALATEISLKLKRLLPEKKVCEFTGDVELTSSQVKNNDIFVCTPEKFEVVTRRETNIFKDLGLLVLDEVHILDDERGAVIESIVARLKGRVTQKQRTRIVGLSATLPNLEDVSEFIQAAATYKFDESFRPVPLTLSVLGVYRSKRNRSDDATERDLMDVCAERVGENLGKQILVFVHSRSDTLNTAKRIAEESLERNTSTDNSRTQLPAQLAQLIEKRVGVHHAGLPRSIRHRMEDLFATQKIKILVCTSTLAWGINLPAHVVIIKGSTFYDQNRGKFVDVGVIDVVQMFGRAGRPQFFGVGQQKLTDIAASAMLICPRNKLTHFTELLSMKRPIESKFLLALVDFLNAEVSLGNVGSIEEAHAWIKNTFLYVRMKNCPWTYGCKDVGDVVDYLVLAVQRLIEHKMIVRPQEDLNDNRSRFYSTEYGTIASHFYVSHNTIKAWLDKIGDVSDEHSLILLLLDSVEFANIIFRENEYSVLKELAGDFGISLKRDGAPRTAEEDAITPALKMLILFVSHLKRVTLYIFSLEADRTFVLTNFKRLLSAFLEVCVVARAFKLFEIGSDLQIRMNRGPLKTKLSIIPTVSDLGSHVNIKFTLPETCNVVIKDDHKIYYAGIKRIFDVVCAKPSSPLTVRVFGENDVSANIVYDEGILKKYGVHLCNARNYGLRGSCTHFKTNVDGLVSYREIFELLKNGVGHTTIPIKFPIFKIELRNLLYLIPELNLLPASTKLLLISKRTLNFNRKNTFFKDFIGEIAKEKFNLIVIARAREFQLSEILDLARETNVILYEEWDFNEFMWDMFLK